MFFIFYNHLNFWHEVKHHILCYIEIDRLSKIAAKCFLTLRGNNNSSIQKGGLYTSVGVVNRTIRSGDTSRTGTGSPVLNLIPCGRGFYDGALWPAVLGPQTHTASTCRMSRNVTWFTGQTNFSLSKPENNNSKEFKFLSLYCCKRYKGLHKGIVQHLLSFQLWANWPLSSFDVDCSSQSRAGRDHWWNVKLSLFASSEPFLVLFL